MPEPYLVGITRQAAEEWIEEFHAAVAYLYDEILPMLIETTSPDERREFYKTVNFPRLLDEEPHLWQQWSADYLALQQKEREAEVEKWKQYEKEVYVQNKLLQEELTPYGQSPSRAMDLGLNVSQGLLRAG